MHRKSADSGLTARLPRPEGRGLRSQVVKAYPLVECFISGASRDGSLEVERGESFPAEYTSVILSHLHHLTQHAPFFPTERNVLCHGDAHLGNIVICDGEALLIDLDGLTFAPYELDIAPSIVATRRFPHLTPATSCVVQDYGAGNVDWGVLNWFVQLRELTMMSWLATLWGHNSTVTSELAHRIATWEGGGVWNPV